ncbi:MAG: hypothetical protein R6U15_07190 [Candidatus Izemoplasmatales bacterium]
MKKKTLLNYYDILIITVIVLQFIIFMLNYETELFMGLVAITQFIMLIFYLLYSIRLRAYFETLTNMEDEFFDKQFEAIKQSINLVSYSISDFFYRQTDIDTFRNMFSTKKIFYNKHLMTDGGYTVSVDLLLITGKGIYLIEFLDPRLIVHGNYQNDKIAVHYSSSNQAEILNPLSKAFPAYQDIKKSLDIKDENLLKSVLVISDDSFAGNLDTLNDNQAIIKSRDIEEKFEELINKKKVSIDKETMDKYEKIIKKKIAG